MRPLHSLLVVLAFTSAASAQIGVRSSFSSDVGDTWVFLGAQNLDGDEANELVLGVPQGLGLSRLVVRDGRTGKVEWDSYEIGTDLDIRVAGWTTSVPGLGRGGDSVSFTYQYGNSPFADVDGDGRTDLVFFDAEAGRLYVIGPDGWRPEPSASR